MTNRVSDAERYVVWTLAALYCAAFWFLIFYALWSALD